MAPDNALTNTPSQTSAPVLIGTPRQDVVAELLGRCDEFFWQASPAVHAELRKFSPVFRWAR